MREVDSVHQVSLNQHIMVAVNDKEQVGDFRVIRPIPISPYPCVEDSKMTLSSSPVQTVIPEGHRTVICNEIASRADWSMECKDSNFTPETVKGVEWNCKPKAIWRPPLEDFSEDSKTIEGENEEEEEDEEIDVGNSYDDISFSIQSGHEGFEYSFPSDSDSERDSERDSETPTINHTTNIDESTEDKVENCHINLRKDEPLSSNITKPNSLPDIISSCKVTHNYDTDLPVVGNNLKLHTTPFLLDLTKRSNSGDRLPFPSIPTEHNLQKQNHSSNILDRNRGQFKYMFMDDRVRCDISPKIVEFDSTSVYNNSLCEVRSPILDIHKETKNCAENSLPVLHKNPDFYDNQTSFLHLRDTHQHDSQRAIIHINEKPCYDTGSPDFCLHGKSEYDNQSTIYDSRAGSEPSTRSSILDLDERVSRTTESEFADSRSDISSPASIGLFRTESLENLYRDNPVLLRRRLTVGVVDHTKILRNSSFPGYYRNRPEEHHRGNGDIFERRNSYGTVPLDLSGVYRTDSGESVFSNKGILHRRLMYGARDHLKVPRGSVSSYLTDSTSSLCSNGEDARRSSFGSSEHFLTESSVSSFSTFGNDSICSVSTGVIKSSNAVESQTVFNGCPAVPSTESSHKRGSTDYGDELSATPAVGRRSEVNEEKTMKLEQQRETVLVETRSIITPPVFTAEDVALRSRVLIMLWVLLGERRLREVGYPIEPVHRILWRTVHVCCSVAGVKSAAAVPLSADHDCGSDMLCFRDHAHRFLEVCAPTREHWKQFGWASLTVDAVVRKIYDEELMPLLRMKSMPPDIEKAVVYLAQLDRPPVMVQNPNLKGESKESSITAPIKKKRGRPAKIPHKVQEGGRIERVMLWRFLLNLLEDPKNSPCIHWVQREEGIFRILNTDWLARLWGRRHGNPRMTYEKMARAMRTYYRSKVLQPVPRLRNLPRKLVYKFNPAVIHKVAAMKLSCSTFSGRGMNYNK